MKLMKKVIASKIIHIIAVLLFFISTSYADAWQTWQYKEKKKEKYSHLSFSFYMAAAFGGSLNHASTRMNTPGIINDYNFTTQNMLYSLTYFEPKSWMIQLDYRMMSWMGMGLLYGNSVLSKNHIKIGPLAGYGEVIDLGNSVRTISVLLTIYINDYIVLGVGPTYNMTDSPSSANRFGFLAHLNIRIPLDDNFSVNGIVQYRYVGITEIGPYSLQNSGDLPPPTVISNTYNFLETQFDYSHLFVGIGMSIYFIQK